MAQHVNMAILCKVLTFILLLPLSSHATDGQHYIFLDEAIAPYTYGAEGGSCERGVTKEIFDNLFSRLGVKYDIRIVPWARAIYSAEQGDCDGIPLLLKTKERESFLVYTDPVVENRELLYFLPGSWGDFSWNSYSDMQGYSVGLINGYAYKETMMKVFRENNVKIRYVKNSEMNIRMLLAGRVDFIIEDETSTKSILREHPDWASRIHAAEKPISSYFWHIGISKSSRLVSRLEEINAALDAMRKDGTLGRILDKR